MQPLNVAIVAVEDFSPFHFSVPSIIFSDKVAAKKRFEVQLCAEQPGIVSSQDGFSINAAYGYEAVEAADIVVIPGGAPQHIGHHKACLMRSIVRDKTARRLLDYAGCVCPRLRRSAGWQTGGYALGVRAGFSGPLSGSSSGYQRAVCG